MKISSLPAGFVYLEDVDASVEQDMRYAGPNNFVGKPLDGYEAPRCILKEQAAVALRRVQCNLRGQGFGLKVYDAYRPQRTLNQFMAWVADEADTKTQEDYYPRVANKQQLVTSGYITPTSEHSFGSAVDVTLVQHRPAMQASLLTSSRGVASDDYREKAGDPVDMGGAFDLFDPISHTDSRDIGEPARRNRQILKTAMEDEGFVNYPFEWWHFGLADPDTKHRHDFVVR